MLSIPDHQAEQITILKGKFKSFWQPLTISVLTESNITNGVEWFDRVGAAGGTIANSVQLVFECLFTRDALPNIAGSSAWPRPSGTINSIICSAGCDAVAGTVEELETARELCLEAPGLILSDEQQETGVRFAPNALEEYHDLKDVSLLSYLSCLPLLGFISSPGDHVKKKTRHDSGAGASQRTFC